MNLKEAKARIEQLEKEVKELRERPAQIVVQEHHYYHYAPQPNPIPTYPALSTYPISTCYQGATVGTSGGSQ